MLKEQLQPGADLPGLGSLLSEALRDLRTGESVHDDEDNAGFQATAEANLLYRSRLLAVILGGLTLAWWPINYVLSRERFWANSVWRVGVLLCCAFCYFVIPRIPWLARRPLRALVAAGIGCVASLAYATSLLGGLDVPQFQLIHLTTLSTLFFPVSLSRRVLTTLLFAAAELAAFFLPHLAYARHPFFGAALSTLGTTVALSVIVGHLFYRLQRRAWFQELAIERRAAEVAALNERLESRVREQTEELRRLASHIESSREAERTVLARELHDELGQELSALRYALALTRRRFARAPASIDQNLGALEQLLDRTAATTRDVVTHLRPRILDDLGLAAAVEWQLGRTASRAGVTSALDVRCDEALLSPALRIAAFRIVQESLTNIEKHARAHHATVSIVTADGRLALAVEDDGIGLGGRTRGHGAGLIGMRERALALGGELVVEGVASGEGTRVRVWLPV